MATTQAEYAHWQQKNAAAINRITTLESQISKLRQQQVEQQQKQQAMNKLRKAARSYLLRQEEYKLLFQSLGARSRRSTRDTGHSQTSIQTAPETKASIAVNQLRGQIKFILEQNLRNQTCDKKSTSLSEPILALLKSSTVEPQMILEQMSNHLIQIQKRAIAMGAEREEDTCPSSEDAELIEEQISLCEQREAESQENNQHLLALKSKADGLVQQIKSKIAANYPDEEVQRMLLKYILTKAQKDRYKLKLDRLQENITKMQGELGSEYLSPVTKNIDATKEIQKQKDMINQLNLHIDDLSLSVIQQLEQSKKLGIEDEKRLWNEINQQQLQIQAIYKMQVDTLSTETKTQRIEKQPEHEEHELLTICHQLALRPNTDMRLILQQVQQLKAQTQLSLYNEAIWIEQLGKSKNMMQLLRQELAKNTLEDEAAYENALVSLATRCTDQFKQEQDKFWTTLDEKLLSISNDCKQRAIDLIKQIQICINESNEMLQGELMVNTTDQDTTSE
ncbi:hypothetical protein INT43_002767 [Umbelopsis isabellina]|uniref:Uncharacterized protein n=1 Tax=Mortierella isabellina TaxID=91625 RepID=A0A8H7Q4G5_MORIS|nr:hypothetical protein INT43_002767 [Umbelopsis isabellina]